MTSNIMICSICNRIMDTIPVDMEFDVWERNWPCPSCGYLWMKSDEWVYFYNMVIPTDPSIKDGPLEHLRSFRFRQEYQKRENKGVNKI